jgi:ubiquinone/menaquinone biosynthesis C-methylase UbiE
MTSAMRGDHGHPGYIIDPGWGDEERRLALLEQHRDPHTWSRLEELGIAPGWRCLEVGAGRGSIAAWMGERVRPGGSVVATDIDPRYCEWVASATVQVIRHDLRCDRLAAAGFDLVHERAVLGHLPDREAVLARLLGWLHPGGRLLVEEFHVSPEIVESSAPELRPFLAALLLLPHVDMLRAARLAEDLAATGAVEVGWEATIPVVHGATPSAAWHQLSLRALTPLLLASGLMREGEVVVAEACLRDPEFRSVGVGWCAGWGQRPVGSLAARAGRHHRPLSPPRDPCP